MSPVYASSTIVDVYKLMATHTHTNASSHTHARAHICHTSAHTSAHASVIEYMCLYPSMLYICKSLPYISFSCLSVLSSGTVWVYPTFHIAMKGDRAVRDCHAIAMTTPGAITRP